MKKALMGILLVAFVALMTAHAFAEECCPPCPPPPCCCNGFTPGFWKHNIAVALELKPGAFSAFEGGPLDGVKLTAAMLDSFAATVGVSLEEAYEVLNTGGGGAIAQARADMANAFNAAAGYGPFVD